MKMQVFSRVVFVFLIVGAAGCSQQQNEASTDASTAGATAAAEVGGPVAHLTQADIRIIAPAPAAEGQMLVYHKVGDDSVGAVSPMAGSEPFVALIGSGDHDVTLMQDGCKFTVEVELNNEKDATAAPTLIKLAATGDRTVMLPGSELEQRRVTAHMAADAQDNFSCNLMLRKKL